MTDSNETAQQESNTEAAGRLDPVVLRTTDELRQEFQDTILKLQGVKYPISRDENGEYCSPAVFHMWTGYCLAALDNGLVKRNENGFIDGYA
jgi:hypothetical protein